jgi:uncharacterized membrane protein YeaQ/YmgE (transglycosylase-associated protein family)
MYIAPRADHGDDRPDVKCDRLVGSLIKKPEPVAKFHPAGFVLSIVGAVVLLVLWRFIR